MNPTRFSLASRCAKLDDIDLIQADQRNMIGIVDIDIPMVARASVDVGACPAIPVLINPARFGLDRAKSGCGSLPPLMGCAKRKACIG